MACSKVFDARVEECVWKFLETGRNQKLSFVVVGRTGAGKSQIINSLIGDHVAEEGHTLEAQTMRIACYKLVIVIKYVVVALNMSEWNCCKKGEGAG